MRWEAFGITDRGRRRRANQDAFLVRAEEGLFAVADGMGGHAAGDVASRTAIEVVEQVVASRDGDGAGSLEKAVVTANLAVFERALREPAEAGMGTTLTVLALVPDEPGYRLAHVGDSRAYILRGRELRQVTHDHTWVQQEVDHGRLTPTQARSHPNSSVLTRAIGSFADVEVDLDAGSIEPDDLILLCSDGLTGMVGDDDLAALLARDLPLDALGAQLVEAANLRGGWDNITAVLIRVSG